MKNELSVSIRAYPVRIRDNRTGQWTEDTVILTREQLRAGAVMHLGDKDIIARMCGRIGFHVLEIGTPVKRTVCIDLERAYLEAEPEPEGGKA